jgi:hypothetical protein
MVKSDDNGQIHEDLEKSGRRWEDNNKVDRIRLVPAK